LLHRVGLRHATPGNTTIGRLPDAARPDHHHHQGHRFILAARAMLLHRVHLGDRIHRPAGLREALIAAQDYASFLKPAWLQTVSESCALEDL
jgi:hypothetical protein